MPVHPGRRAAGQLSPSWCRRGGRWHRGVTPGAGGFLLPSHRGCSGPDGKAGEVWGRLVVPGLCPPVPNHPVALIPSPPGPGGLSPGCSHGKTLGKGMGGGFPVPAPPGLISPGPEAFPAETFPSTNTMRSFSSPRRTMRHCPAHSAGNQTGNVSRGTLIPSPAPEEPGWGSPNIPKPFWEGFCTGRGRGPWGHRDPRAENSCWNLSAGIG